MRIGPVEIGPGALLAPMEAVTDLPFRTICEEHGAALTFTEFLSAEALIRGSERVVRRMWPSLGRRRFVVQVVGRQPSFWRARPRWRLRLEPPWLTSTWAVQRARSLQAHVARPSCASRPGRRDRLRRARSLAVVHPVTVKQRLGWSDSSINAPEFACAWSRLERPW